MDTEIITCLSTGFDYVDLEKSSEKGIDVCNISDYGANTVAEHTFGLILTISLRIHEAVNKVESGEFDHQGLKGFDLKGKTLGVIGTGRIGQEIIKMAQGFDIEIIAFDPHPKERLEDELNFNYVSFDELIRKSDIVALNCPLTGGNHQLLSEDEFEKIDDTVVSNTARGELIDTTELIKALENGNVSRAGLDVLEEDCVIEEDIELLSEMSEECYPQKIVEDHFLMERDDFIVTPHNAFNSVEALQRIADQTVQNLENRKNMVNQ